MTFHLKQVHLHHYFLIACSFTVVSTPFMKNNLLSIKIFFHCARKKLNIYFFILLLCNKPKNQKYGNAKKANKQC